MATTAAPSAAPATPATTTPPRVISWLRDPNLPGRAGEKMYTEWVLRSGGATGIEVHKDRYVEPLGGGSPVLSKYRFGSQVDEQARPAVEQALQAAAATIAGSPDLARMREVSSDGFFFGPIDPAKGPFGQTPDIGIGQGKVLVDSGDGARYFVGDLRDMPEIVRATKRAVDLTLSAPRAKRQ